MRRFHSVFVIAIAAFALCALRAVPAEAQRISRSVSWGGDFSVQIDSDEGVLPTYRYRGYTYVEGRRGLRYTIRVTNNSGERVEAVVTVDGRDVITGRQGDYRRQRGYVIDPYGAVEIDGFRTSWSGVAAFRFTDVDDSYAARMGDDSDVGVIGVAVFREKRRDPPPVYYGDYYDYRDGRLGSARGKAAPAPSASADAAGGGYGTRAHESERAEQGIGTGYGEDRYSPASETTFDRRSRSPDAKLAVYYDDHEGLIARGVIRRYEPPRPRPYEPNPFPRNNDPGFAPPPPPYYWE